MTDSLDTTPVTDDQICRALFAAYQAVEVAGALLELADPRQLAAVWEPCPWADRQDMLLDFQAWMEAVIDGETGLQVKEDAA
jgi:hypothetical protein